MSEVIMSYRGREIRQPDVLFLRELIARNPKLSRNALSKLVCEKWNWVQPNGRARDSICRSLMLELHRAGHIQLPPVRFRPVNNAIVHRPQSPLPMEFVDTSPLEGKLASLGALEIGLVGRSDEEKTFNHLLEQYHYLGLRRPVGEHLKYLVRAGGRAVACLCWNSGPLKLKLRDQLVGAHWKEYCHNLHLIAYNSRFLIAPWVRVPHLASHLLGRIARRISRDWSRLYNHRIVLLESFVDTERFAGTCYRAANWKCQGRSDGRGTKSKTGAKASIKELWTYPLSRHFRTDLLG